WHGARGVHPGQGPEPRPEGLATALAAAGADPRRHRRPGRRHLGRPPALRVVCCSPNPETPAMNFRTTYVLFAILGAMFLALIVVLWIGPTPPPTGYVLPSAHDKYKGLVTADDIDRVTIEDNRPEGSKIVFAAQGEDKERHWRLEAPISGAVDDYTINTLVGNVLDARRDENAEATNNLGERELAPPRRVITLEGTGQTFRLHLGDESP